MTIPVLYSCVECGIKRVSVEVRARGPAEDIRHWMDDLTVTIAADHRQRSPRCYATKITEVMIPIHGRNRAGDPASH